MTDTAELIARLERRASDYDRQAAKVLAAQAQEIERLKVGFFDFADDTYTQRDQWRQRAEAAEAEVKRITQMAIGSIYAEWERRVEGAEARVRELEDHRRKLVPPDIFQVLTKLEAERDAIEAKTIERCAEIADAEGSAEGLGIGAAIRALRLNPAG